MNIMDLKGIGEKTAALFSKLNIETTKGLLTYFPRDYDYFEDVISISQISEGVHSFRASCIGATTSKFIRSKNIVTAKIGDDTGTVTVVYFNMPYIRKVLEPGTEHVFRGNVIKRGDLFVLQQPKIYKLEEYAKLANSYQPIYSTTKGLSSLTIQKSVKKAYDAETKIKNSEMVSTLIEPLPDEILRKHEFMSYESALINMHFPKDKDSLIEARRRIAYQEFYDFIYNIEINRDSTHRRNDYPMIEVADTHRLIESLPFRLTDDQNEVWSTIQDDMCNPHGLRRLVQGDVGSGKTIIAILALLMTAANGYQGALMAPTEVLARQHYETISEMAQKYSLPMRPVLLTGDIKGNARKEILKDISDGAVNVIIGTHALFQDKVEYKKLALVITDEQHRFGVLQRETLKEKGGFAHVLIMSATPIPRTLAMILYGDLDVSAIHTMPTGRLPIKNCVVDTSFRKKAYEFIIAEVDKGNQVYIICPQVESGDLPGVENVTDYAADLKDKLPEKIRIQYLHGKMKPSRKNEIMEEMAKGNIDVLVSTTVIEVGINVPNATLMYIENAERFGLAQLHQLRGRVGRSDKQSYCIFMMGNSSAKSKERLGILEKSNDGFEIASQDMKLRGPGDIFGIRQSGEMFFSVGDIYQDHDLIMIAAEDVKQVLKR